MSKRMLPCPLHNSKNTDKIKCPVCQRSITYVVPLKANWVETLCWMKALHPTLQGHSGLHCLPSTASSAICAVCRTNILAEGTTFHEKYISTSKKRLVCCGADCHLEYARSLAGSKCPVCRTPLKMSDIKLPQSSPLALNSDDE